jgi:Fe-Mn family superoxide dismutase
MELHHQTYVTGLNSALDTIAAGDPVKAAAAAPLLNFHGGGHINHSLFWENLAPASRDGGGEPDGALKVCLLPLSPIGLSDRSNLLLLTYPQNRNQSPKTSAPSTPSASK